MRCECCDRLLDDVEATARFAESGEFVNMCTKCRGWLPKELKIILRNDLIKREQEDDDSINELKDFNFGGDDGYEN